MIKVFVAGASGNVGRLVARTAIERDDMELVGGWCAEAGQDLGVLAGGEPIGIAACGDLREGLEASKPDVVVDFTSTVILKDSLRLYAELGLDLVLGTTGLDDEGMAEARDMVREKGLRWVIVANYGLGINLVTDFIEKARQFYPYVSFVDRHHANMANAPSGTAAVMAQSVPEGPIGEVKSKEVYPGVLGAEINGYPVQSQRLPFPAPYSEHEIILGRQDEIIRISVQDFTSDIYMDGVFLAVGKIASLPAGSVITKLSDLNEV